MSPVTIIDKYYPEDNERKHILLVHSRLVAEKALSIADHHPELQLDKDFLYEAIGTMALILPSLATDGQVKMEI